MPSDQTSATITHLMSLSVLYSGGTFGCVGHPLVPLAADLFVPILRNQLHQLYATDWQICVLEPLLDSSQIEPQHWLLMMQQCLSLYQHQHTPIIVIHGTDTLAYTAAFLAEAFAGSDIRLCVTGSQLPLLHAFFETQDIKINQQSDALDNLKTAIQAALNAPVGVNVAFSGQHWPAQSCQKIHSQAIAAFTGHPQTSYPANSYQPLSSIQHQHWLIQARQRCELLQQTLSQIELSVYYATPQPIEHLLEQLTNLLRQRPAGLILVGYGIGNFPDHPALRHLLMEAQQNDCLVVMATQVPFGGTDTRYASGHGLATVGVLPSASLTLPAIYARLLWICATQPTASERRQRWLDCLHETQF